MGLGIYEKSVCRKIADTFELAAAEGCHPVGFMKNWLQSGTMQLLVELNLKEVAQSPLYHLNSFRMELQEKGISLQLDPLNKEYGGVMYWGGYFVMYLAYQEHLTGPEIEAAYDVEEILKCYDTLHTVSPPVAIDLAGKNFRKHASIRAVQGRQQ